MGFRGPAQLVSTTGKVVATGVAQVDDAPIYPHAWTGHLLVVENGERDDRPARAARAARAERAALIGGELLLLFGENRLRVTVRGVDGGRIHVGGIDPYTG